MSGTDLFGNVSTLDNGERSDFDFYETPAWMTRSLLTHHPVIRGKLVLECASGNDAITTVLRDEGGCTVLTNDIDRRHPAMTHHDATKEDFWKFITADCPIEWVISNLPFNVAFPILEHALHYTARVAFLLRKTFLEPTDDRGPFLAQFPPQHIIGLPRHKFRQGVESTDSVSCDWMIWNDKGGSARPIIVDYGAKSRGRRP